MITHSQQNPVATARWFSQWAVLFWSTRKINHPMCLSTLVMPLG